MELPTKPAVHRALCEALARAHEVMVRSAKESAEGATHAENRQEGDKDMRATEQSYLARGQAARAEDIAEELSRFETMKPVAFGPDARIAAGALVHVDLDGDHRVLFVIAQGGGTVLDVDGVQVTVVTPSSPMGRALLGRREGDDIELVVSGKKREGSVVSVR